MSPTYYNAILRRPASCDDTRIRAISDSLADQALSASAVREDRRHDGAWVLTWLFDHRPETESLTDSLNDRFPGEAVSHDDWQIEPVPGDTDWLAESYEQFAPFVVGSFYIYGSHYDGPLPDDKHTLQIDAATAFGSGEHGTTAGCLRLMQDLHEAGIGPIRIMDMGTGSGILAIAAARLWSGADILAVDIEAESVRVAGHHAQINGVADSLTGVKGDGFATPDVQSRAPYDLVIANILAAPLIDMAAPLCRTVATGGAVILSGMLDEQAGSVRRMYEQCLMTPQDEVTEDGWTSLLLRKPA